MNIRSDHASLPSPTHMPPGQLKFKSATQDAPVPQAPPAPAPEPTDTFESGEKASGVLRLLEAGHFSGVADVRLRINFQEELVARQEQGARDAIAMAAPDFLTEMQAALGQYADAAAVTPEQSPNFQATADSFIQTAQALVDAVETGEVGPGDLAGQLADAFDVLAGQLNPPAAPLEEGETPAEESTLPEEPVSTEVAVAALRDAFQAALSNLSESLSSGPGLPELSPPSGQGKAYEKFLQIYLSMQQPPEPAEQPALDVQI